MQKVQGFFKIFKKLQQLCFYALIKNVLRLVQMQFVLGKIFVKVIILGQRTKSRSQNFAFIDFLVQFCSKKFRQNFWLRNFRPARFQICQILGRKILIPNRNFIMVFKTSNLKLCIDHKRLSFQLKQDSKCQKKITIWPVTLTI